MMASSMTIKSSLIPPKKKSKKRKIRHGNNVAAAYHEDLGTQGTKKSQVDDGKSAAIPGLPLTRDEKNRRARRMVRAVMFMTVETVS